MSSSHITIRKTPAPPNGIERRQVLSSSRAQGLGDLLRLWWEATPKWVQITGKVIAASLVISLVFFDTFAGMWLWEVGAR